MTPRRLRIVFFGTPEFASAQLDAIFQASIPILAVVTAPDKPAGRGRKISYSAVKQYALSKNLPLLQPGNLKDPAFVDALNSLKADVYVVVAFRMLPKVVWQIPPRGTFNLHASLLPQYRGAAPINWAIINGETETGLTTFFINEEIDAGQVILQQKLKIHADETAGLLHDRMMEAGKELVLNTIVKLADGNITLKDQGEMSSPLITLKTAPKIFREHCAIDWAMPLRRIHDFVRGLSPHPVAVTTLTGDHGRKQQLKLYEGSPEYDKHEFEPGNLLTDNKSWIKICHPEGYYIINHLQLPGKKVMDTASLLRGFKFEGKWRVL